LNKFGGVSGSLANRVDWWYKLDLDFIKISG